MAAYLVFDVKTGVDMVEKEGGGSDGGEKHQCRCGGAEENEGETRNKK